MDLILAILGLLVVSATWLHYLTLIPAEKVPQRPFLHAVFMVVGMGLSMEAVIRPLLSNASFPIVPFILALLSLPTGGLFLYLLTIAALPDTPLQVVVGDRLPSFAAVNDVGEVVETAGFHQQRLLLKFFRGHW